MTTATNQAEPLVKFAQINLTLSLAYKNGGTGDMEKILSWISACLNCNTNHVEVTISNPTGDLHWPDFLDAPGFGPEHPDYQDAVETLKKVESWLAMDRKALIRELLQQHDKALSDRSS